MPFGSPSCSKPVGGPAQDGGVERAAAEVVHGDGIAGLHPLAAGVVHGRGVGLG